MELPDRPSAVITKMNGYNLHDRNLYELRMASIKSKVTFVQRLMKSIYGLRQMAKQWHLKKKSDLGNCGVEQYNTDPCLF